MEKKAAMLGDICYQLVTILYNEVLLGSTSLTADDGKLLFFTSILVFTNNHLNNELSW